MNGIDISVVDFEVERVPLVTTTGLKTEREGIVRKDTDEVIGVVSPKYGMLEHRTALKDSIPALAKLEGEFGLKRIRVSGNGARMYAYIEGKREIDLKGDGKDILRPTLILQNSMDGSTRFGFRAGALRLVCTNGMVAGVTMSQVFVKHTNGVDFDAILASGHQALRMLEEESIPKWKHMVTTPLNKEFAIQRLSDKRLGIPDRVNKRVIELSREVSTDTLWDLYNHYTYHLTHEYKGSEDRRVFISAAVERVLTSL